MSDSEMIVSAFGEEHASQLTGITVRQLRYWDRTGFFTPSYAEENRRLPFSRVYSFRDIVALRVLNVLRNQYNVSLHHLRDVSRKLSGFSKEKWTATKLYVLNRRIVWVEPGTKLPQEVASGQYVVPVVLGSVLADTEHDVVKLNVRDDKQIGAIERSRFISRNAPVLAGTRIPVIAIKRFAESGYSVSQILEEYPDLTEKDVHAAVAYDDALAA